MKNVVIRGTRFIGSVVDKFCQLVHLVVVGSDEGLAEATKVTNVVIDLANSPSSKDDALREFIRTASKNLLPLQAQ